MSSYTTLLGSYRMSASSQVLPPPSSSRDYYHQHRYHEHQEQQVAAARPSSYYSRPSSSSATTRPRSSAPSSSSGAKLSPSRHGGVAASRQPLPHQVNAADLDNQQRYYNNNYTTATQPQTYLSTSLNTSTSSAYYIPSATPTKSVAASTTPTKQLHYAGSSAASTPVRSSAAASEQKQSNQGNSSQVLTQVQRTSSGGSPKSHVMNNANHHRLRSSMYRPKWDPALPRTRYSHRPLLILDLDETLVHATTSRPHGGAAAHCDLHFNVDMGPNQAPVPVWVALRPGAKQFVYDIAAYFEVAVFTASIKNYADKVCECLDPSGTLIQHRLYRDHCSDVDGVFVKDLSLLNRPLHRVAILDNSPHAYLFHPENSIPILSWFDCPRDNELKKLTPLLIHRLAQADEVYGILEQYRADL